MSSLGLGFDKLSSEHVSLSSSSSASVSESASLSSPPNSTTTLILNLTNLTLTASDLLDKINLTFSDLVDIAYGIKVLEPSVNLSSILPCWTSSSSTPSSSSSSSSSSSLSSSFSTSSSLALNNQFRPISNVSSINYLPPELDNCASVIYNFSSYLMDNELNLINYNNIANRIDNPPSISTPPLVHHHHHSVEGDNSSLWPKDDTIKSDKVYWALCLVLLPFLAVFGNILVILAVYKEKSLQTVTNYFIVSLAFADLLVAGVVMPFAVYYLINVDWELSETLCDLWVAVDVTCSTASILNLVAISIDRFIAVTRPIKYAKHKSNTRVSLTIAIVWIVSAAIGSPIVFGLNTSPERKPELCIFYNSDFIIFSSLGSFYIPCVLMVFLYYKIFKAIHDRAKKSIGNNKNKPISSTDSSHTVLVIENKSETAKLKERTGFLGRKRTNSSNNSSFMSTNQSVSSCGGGTIGPVLCNNLATSQQLHHHHSQQIGNSGVERKSPLPKIMETESLTNNGSGSIEDDDDDDRELDITGCSGGVSGSLECHIIANKQTVLNDDSYVKKNVQNLSFHSDSQQNEVDDDDDDEEEDDDDDYRGPSSCDLENTGTLKHRNYHGNADSGYGPSAFEETPFCVYNPTAETLSSQPSSPTIIKNKIITSTEIVEGGGGSFGAIGTSSSSSGGCGESQELNNNNDEPNIDSKSNKKNSRFNKLLNRSGQLNENGLTVKQGQPQHQQQMHQQQQQQQQPVKKRSRFNLGRKHKTSAKRREKASAKRERKATKTLAIVLGVFLICWAPFFTCNIIDAVCIKLKADDDCKPGMNAFLLTTWLGYMNSCVNPVIYTIFNPEFRKAFKKIIKSTFSLR